jgi:PKD repeat protein
MRQLFLCRSQVSFDASGSQDVEAPLFAHEWLFHDGSTVTGLSAERDYPEDGDYPVTLTVIDTAGSTASHTITVTVTNVAPTVLTASDVTGVEGSAIQFVATFTDPGVFDTHSALIDWGDGTTSAGVLSGSSSRPQITLQW